MEGLQVSVKSSNTERTIDSNVFKTLFGQNNYSLQINKYSIEIKLNEIPDSCLILMQVFVHSKNQYTEFEATLFQMIEDKTVAFSNDSKALNAEGNLIEKGLTDFQFRMFMSGLQQNSRIWFVCGDKEIDYQYDLGG